MQKRGGFSTVSIGDETKGHLRRMFRVILVLVDTSCTGTSLGWDNIDDEEMGF